MLRVYVSIWGLASIVQYLERSLLLLSANLPLRMIKLCSVVFGVSYVEASCN